MPLPANYAGGMRVNSRHNRPIGLSTLYHQQWLTIAASPTQGAVNPPLAGGATDVATSQTGAGAGASKALTINGTRAVGGKVIFAHHRPVQVVATHATSVVGTVIKVEGYDLDGQYLYENITIPATGTTQTVNGKKSFKIVTAVTNVATGDASANSYTVGANGSLGLDVKAAFSGNVLKEFVDGAQVNPPTGTLTAGVLDGSADQRGLYTPAAAPNGTHTYEICYITDDPWNS